MLSVDPFVGLRQVRRDLVIARRKVSEHEAPVRVGEGLPRVRALLGGHGDAGQRQRFSTQRAIDTLPPFDDPPGHARHWCSSTALPEHFDLESAIGKIARAAAQAGLENPTAILRVHQILTPGAEAEDAEAPPPSRSATTPGSVP